MVSTACHGQLSHAAACICRIDSQHVAGSGASLAGPERQASTLPTQPNPPLIRAEVRPPEGDLNFRSSLSHKSWFYRGNAASVTRSACMDANGVEERICTN